MNLKHCPRHGWYSGGFPACPDCGNPPQAAKTGAKRGKRRKQGSRDAGKPLNATTARKRLQAHGLDSDAKLIAGLRTGATVTALYGTGSGVSEGVFLRYVAIVERLATERPELMTYRNRLISYSEAA